jgi:hypothetical protein
LLIITICNTFNLQNIVSFTKDNTVNLHGHLSIDKDTGKYIGQGLNSIGSNIGLGASIAGVATAISKGIAKSSVPPLQKAGIIIAGAVSAGFAHSIITTINRKQISNSTHNNFIYSNINKFVDDSSTSPLQTLLFDIEGLNVTCLSLIVLLTIQIIFKLHLKDNITLKFSSFLGENMNSNLEYYINKIINLNKKMSTIYI